MEFSDSPFLRSKGAAMRIREFTVVSSGRDRNLGYSLGAATNIGFRMIYPLLTLLDTHYPCLSSDRKGHQL